MIRESREGRSPQAWTQAVAAGLVLTAGAAVPAQRWDALPAAEPVQEEAFHVLASSGTELHAYSAMAQSFRPLGTPHGDPNVMAPAVRSGDWTALVRLAPGHYRAYSARLHDVADIAFTDHPDQIFICVEDDVILIIGNQANRSGHQACAYSAQTNRWERLAIGSGLPRDVACSRFVVGLLRGDDGFGFSARHGRWVPSPGGADCSLTADGNVLLMDIPAPGRVKAFSGVLGEWAVSPPQQPDTSAVIDHNVALIREAGRFGIPDLCACSAYAGRWTTGRASRGPATLSDNVVLVRGTANPHRLYGFGAWPGAWQNLELPVGATYTVSQGADQAIVHDRSSGRAHGLSGLCDDAWRSESASASLTFGAFDHLAVGVGVSDALAFSGANGGWTRGSLSGAGVVFSTHGVILAYGGSGGTARRTAYSARHGDFVTEPRSSGTHHAMTALHFVADYDVSAEELIVFHERSNRWRPVPLTGAGSLSRYTQDRNVMLASFAGSGFEVVGISGQRADAVPAPGFSGARLDWGIEENVAWARDSAGTLHAFGTPEVTHSLFQYPLDSELQVFTPTGTTDVPAKVMVRSDAGASVAVMVGFGRHDPPITVVGLGALHIDTIALSVTVGTVGSNGLIAAPFELPLNGPPACFELFSQALAQPAGGRLRLIGSTAETLRYH